jgi:hypothetical protein
MRYARKLLDAVAGLFAGKSRVPLGCMSNDELMRELARNR